MTKNTSAEQLLSDHFEQHPSGHWTLTGDAGEVAAFLQSLTAPTDDTQEMVTAFVSDWLEDLVPDDWLMEYLPEKGLSMTGITPVAGQFMLQVDCLARDLLAARLALALARSELTKVQSIQQQMAASLRNINSMANQQISRANRGHTLHIDGWHHAKRFCQVVGIQDSIIREAANDE